MIPLKPCPFCGGESYIPLDGDNNDEPLDAIACDHCCAYVTFCDALTPQKVAEKWNKRT